MQDAQVLKSQPHVFVGSAFGGRALHGMVNLVILAEPACPLQTTKGLKLQVMDSKQGSIGWYDA